jgi:hypothetical protein
VKKHFVIYIPGLGDFNIANQMSVVGVWRIYGVAPYVNQMNWADGEPFAPKLNRLLAKIDEAKAQGYTVSLIAASAGAGAALNAYVLRKNSISGVILICGKIHNPQTVHHRTYRFNPAFKESMDRLPDSLNQLDTQDKTKIVSIRPITDMSVPPKDTIIEGVKSKKIYTFGHVASIAYCLTFKSYSLIRILKKLAAKS